jgi:dipeptide transport system permease protein
MLRFLFRRVTLIIPTYIGVTFLAFILLHLVPG